MSNKLQQQLPEYIEQLLERVLDENPLHQRFILNSLGNITDEELERLDGYVDYCLKRGLDTEYLAKSYLTIVEDTLREQLYFIKNREYRHKSFADVAESVYFNDEYMHRYMYGLALTSFLWPNHLGMARFFRESLPRDKPGRYLEVGPGHGYYLVTAMRESLFDHFLGIDISSASIEQTRDIVDYFKPPSKVNVKLSLSDFLDADQLEDSAFDAIVMGEVLEHVEQPDAFLRRLARLAKKDAYIFITTCINAPAIDHIYLWRDIEELEVMFKDCSLGIKQALHLPYQGKSVAQCVTNGLAINVAYVLEKI
jgi:2-polyprenyl-3-methyl-5-hydroxy-6-metoxy-1,4-benzoquinol methylase